MQKCGVFVVIIYMKKVELPNDIDALKDLVIQEHHRAELFKYRHELLARRYFGQSSEKRKDALGQQLLFELPSEPERPAPAAPADQDVAPRKKKHGGGRKRFRPNFRASASNTRCPKNNGFAPVAARSWSRLAKKSPSSASSSRPACS
jgi:hypothetical protein